MSGDVIIFCAGNFSAVLPSPNFFPALRRYLTRGGGAVCAGKYGSCMNYVQRATFAFSWIKSSFPIIATYPTCSKISRVSNDVITGYYSSTQKECLAPVFSRIKPFDGGLFNSPNSIATRRLTHPPQNLIKETKFVCPSKDLSNLSCTSCRVHTRGSISQILARSRRFWGNDIRFMTTSLSYRMFSSWKSQSNRARGLHYQCNPRPFYCRIHCYQLEAPSCSSRCSIVHRHHSTSTVDASSRNFSVSSLLAQISLLSSVGFSLSECERFSSLYGAVVTSTLDVPKMREKILQTCNHLRVECKLSHEQIKEILMQNPQLLMKNSGLQPSDVMKIVMHMRSNLLVEAEDVARVLPAILERKLEVDEILVGRVE